MNEKSSDKTMGGPLSRRHVFAGAGAVGALAAAAAVLPLAQPGSPLAARTKPAPAEGGYQLTEHVQRYYQTARV
jgi:hypothetical protein